MRRSKTPQWMAVFFVGVLLGLHVSYSRVSEGSDRGVLGGPSSEPDPAVVIMAAVAGNPPIHASVLEEDTSVPASENRELFLAGSLLDTKPVVGKTIFPTTIITYKVKKGDTLSRIAAAFGVSQRSIQSANPKLGKVLSVGEELIIITNSGILYRIKDGDTLGNVALSYGILESQVQDLNPGMAAGVLTSGDVLVLPPTADPPQQEKQTASSLPALKGYFIQPAPGFNWGRLHNYNAVDIANGCGTPIKAAAEGIVVKDESGRDGLGGWNGGYGLFVYIEHPNGTRTRYAHLKEAVVAVGDFVERGEEIGEMGNSGNTHGVTGCHLHFEVYDAENPFVKD